VSRGAIRIALVTEIPAPFRIPLFNALAAAPEVQLDVLFLAERDPRRTYTVFRDEFRFRSRVVPGLGLHRGRHWLVFSAGTVGRLRRLGPDVVIVGGWNQPAFWLALAYARARRTPLVTWVESTAHDERPGFAPLEKAKRAMLAASAAVLVPGRASAQYVHSLGVPDERIAIAPNAVDLGIFGRRVAEARAARDELRKTLGLERCAFLYVGRLDPEKGLTFLLGAVAGLPADLVVIGTGTEEERLRQAAPPNVRFLGRLERDELVPWYAAADALVLPSTSEPWGMVLNEGAAAGLPLVATDAAGAALDLVDDGVNGFRVPAGNEAALRASLIGLAEDEELRRSAGERSREIAARFTPEAWARAVAGLARDLLR
jgi:glycosyltransferase involved in cell wall biosynthesis